MKAIERQLAEKWRNSCACSIDNTVILHDPVYNALILALFGNVIARKDLNTGRVSFTLAGWNTITTRSRLKNVIGAPVSQVNRAPVVWLSSGDKREISARAWYDLESLNEIN